MHPFQELRFERALANKLNIKVYGPDEGPFMLVSRSERRVYIFGENYAVSSQSSFTTNLLDVLCDALPADCIISEVGNLSKIESSGVFALGSTPEEAAIRLIIENPSIINFTFSESKSFS